MTLRLNLGQYLKDHGISAYRLVQEVEGVVAPNTVYGLARKPAQRIDLDTVSSILQALERVRGQRVMITEVLEDVPDTLPADPLPTLDDLLAQTPREDLSTFPRFRRDPHRRPAPLGDGPGIAEMISEGRER
ncbi:helix-turn-helix transcriptional regulator [Deinococcus sp.]|uniref:helix-turn-helix domain-containing protein n=1 Tax=Deinococcus sp. TaxID=47478 RepID=UPI00286992B1|nr:helix-turn-helix transcriptional regulator [Deinococcus sp.]